MAMPFAAKNSRIRLGPVFFSSALKESVFARQLGPEPAPLTGSFPVSLHGFFPFGLYAEASS